MKEQEATKRRLIELTDELTAAVFGTELHPRPIACICRDLHVLGTSPEGRAVGFARPYTWLEAWRAFTLAGPSEAEQERRRLVDAGWATPDKDDARRQTMQRKAEEAAREFERLRAEQRGAEEEAYAAQQTPLTRRALEQAITGVGVVSSKT